MKDVLSFLAPKAGSATFLILILSTFFLGTIIGVIKYIVFTDKLSAGESQYKDDQDGCAQESPIEHLRSVAQPESVLRLLAPFPGVLVTIGILGTFIGIGMAISEAIPAMEQGQDVQVVQDALKQLLNAVKFKFQTSAYGILASLIFIAFQTLIEWQILRRFESAAEELAPRRVWLSEALSATLGDQIGLGIERGFATLSGSLQQSLKLLSMSTATLQGEVGSLREGVEVLSVSVELFGEQVSAATQSLSEGSAKLGNLGADIDQSLARVAAGLQEAGEVQTREINAALLQMNEQLSSSLTTSQQAQSKAAREQADSLKAVMGELKGSLNETLAKMNQATEDSSRALNHALSTFRQEHKEASDQQSELLKQILGDMLTSQMKASGELKTSLDLALSKLLSSVNTMSEEQRQSLLQLNAHQAHAASSLEVLSNTLKDYQRNSAKLVDILEQQREANAGKAAPPPPRREVRQPPSATTTDFL